VLTGIPTVGCAKSILVGKVAGLAEAAGSTAELRAGVEVVGLAVRTREKGKPVYLSIGHKIDLKSALALVLSCTRGRRLPEPGRLAHQLVTQARKGPSEKEEGTAD
jgi:deoxyribonuclease V